MYKTGYEWPDWVVPAAIHGPIGRGSGPMGEGGGGGGWSVVQV